MNNEQTKKLCIRLLLADSETEVVQILKDAGYWDDQKSWRLYGDKDNPYSLIGNQQGRSDAALAEKIINSIDHCLLAKCLEAGIDPESEQAPQSIREAIALFYEQRASDGFSGGTIAEWSTARRTEVAKNIAVAVTGEKKAPCISIVDQGEGQTPNRVPHTFMSLGASNKMRIPFVQGKFNMGSTGVLEFCGTQNIQLIITKRNPSLIDSSDNDDSGDMWGFTVVRREDPSGSARNSVYTYLAPEGSSETPGRGGVLRFESDVLPLMPEKRNAASRDVSYGSLVKLYNYDMKGFSSNAVMKDGLLYRLDACLPSIALPIRVHECRKGYRGHEGSFDTTLTGLSVRLADNRAGNLVEGYPDSVPFSVQGQNLIAQIYAFEDGKADTYRKREGVILTVNGQTHGAIPKTIFNRKAVKLGRLASSLLIIVDCSSLTSRSIEKLFLASRDRLRDNTLRREIEKQLEKILKTHQGLKKLAADRKAAEIKDRLADDKPLENILDSILKQSPTLSKLFLLGKRLARPFDTSGTGQNGNGDGPGPGKGKEEFTGKPHPTYFHFAKNKSGQLSRNFEKGRDCRVAFGTDVVNDYFKRNSNAGEMTIQLVDGIEDHVPTSFFVNLHNGRAQLNLSFPDEIEVGTNIKIKCSINDPTLQDPYVNLLDLTVTEKTAKPPSPRKAKEPRNGSGGKGDQLSEAGIKIPKIISVEEKDWAQRKFDQYSACAVVEDSGEGDQSEFTFYVNVDNLYLQTEMKGSKDDPQVLRAKFVFANVLMGLAIIHEHQNNTKKKTDSDSDDEVDTAAIVKANSRAIAPFLLPMISQLAELSDEDIQTFGQIGDDE